MFPVDECEAQSISQNIYMLKYVNFEKIKRKSYRVAAEDVDFSFP